jgi:hypothetical protein
MQKRKLENSNLDVQLSGSDALAANRQPDQSWQYWLGHLISSHLTQARDVT